MKTLLLTLFLATTTFAQPDTIWTRTYGGDAYDVFHSVEVTPDGGFLLAGQTYSSGAGDSDGWVVKTDSLGNVQWSRTFGGQEYDNANSARIGPDGNYWVAGHVYVDSILGWNAVLMKYSPTGDSLWSGSYGGESFETVRSFLYSPSLGWLLTGVAYRESGTDLLLMNIDNDGTLLWTRYLGGNGGDQAFAIDLTNDNGFIIAGYTSSFGAGSEDMWLLRLDQNGDSLWSRTFGGGALDQGHSVLATSDGGFVIGGWTHSFGLGFDNAYVAKVDSEGEPLWEHVYGDADQIFIDDLVESPDHSIYATGFFTTAVEVGNVWLLKLNADGDSLWEKHWMRDQLSFTKTLALLPDNSIVLAGVTSYEFNDFSGDAWLLKTELDPLPADDLPVYLPENISLSVYPNPFNSSTQIKFLLPKSASTSLIIYDILGRIVFKNEPQFLRAGTHLLPFSGENLSSGSYIVRLQNDQTMAYTKIVLLK